MCIEFPQPGGMTHALEELFCKGTLTLKKKRKKIHALIVMRTEYPEGRSHCVHMEKKESYRKIQQIEKYLSTILLKGNKVQGVWPDLRLQINGKLRICSPKSPYCFVLFSFFCFSLHCFVLYIPALHEYAIIIITRLLAPLWETHTDKDWLHCWRGIWNNSPLGSPTCIFY